MYPVSFFICGPLPLKWTAIVGKETQWLHVWGVYIYMFPSCADEETNKLVMQGEPCLK